MRGVLLLVAGSVAACGSGADVGSRSAAQTGGQPGPSFWTERTMVIPDAGADPNPAPRRNAGMAFDPTRGVAVMYGGLSDDGLFGDTWEWSSASRTWTPVDTVDSPGDLYGHTMVAFDGRIVLFGGNDGVDAVDETWVYETSGETRNWRRLDFAEAATPPARYAHGMAVGTQGTLGPGVFVFGGRDPGVATDVDRDDTWLLTSLASGWSNVSDTAEHRPSGRFRHAMTFDSAAGRFVVFGGEDAAGRFDDTWVSSVASGKLRWSSPS